MNRSPLLMRTLQAATLSLALSFTLAGGAGAAPLLIDGFDAPTSPRTSVLTAIGDTTLIDTTAAVLGGVRDTYHHLYVDPAAGGSSLSIGGGVLSMQQGAGARAEVLLQYGAFTRPGGNPVVSGPHLNLDLSGYDAFELLFDDGGIAQNIGVVMYTANPLDPLNPLYYSTTAVNAAPLLPGGPMRVILPFTADPTFNFSNVDGIVLVMNRANSTTGNGFVLDSFSITNRVPEPGTGALAALGMLGVLLLAALRRRATGPVTAMKN